MPQINQSRPVQGRLGCEMLPGGSHSILNLIALPEQRIIITHLGPLALLELVVPHYPTEVQS